jgi:hypothetical protein
MWVRVAITIVLLSLPTALHAQAEKRIALVGCVEGSPEEAESAALADVIEATNGNAGPA